MGQKTKRQICKEIDSVFGYPDKVPILENINRHFGTEHMWNLLKSCLTLRFLRDISGWKIKLTTNCG